MPRSLTILLLLLTLAGAACSSDDAAEDTTAEATAEAAPAEEAPAEEAPAEAAPAGDAAAITIQDFAYGTPISVAAGTTVTVTNADGAPHTLTADDDSFDTGSIAGGSDGSFTATGSGTVPFHCEIHPTMMGELEITG